MDFCRGGAFEDIRTRDLARQIGLTKIVLFGVERHPAIEPVTCRTSSKTQTTVPRETIIDKHIMLFGSQIKYDKTHGTY